MKKISVSANFHMPSIMSCLGFSTTITVEDCALALYERGHKIGIYIEELKDILYIRISEATTLFDATGKPESSSDDPKGFDLYVSGDAFIDGYSGTHDGCQAFLDRLRTAPQIQINSMPSVLK